jgi:hypothetical protein
VYKRQALGFEALLIAVFATLGSITGALLLWKNIKKHCSL